MTDTVTRRLAAGLCGRCGKRPLAKGSKGRCRACLHRANDWQAQHGTFVAPRTVTIARVSDPKLLYRCFFCRKRSAGVLEVHLQRRTAICRVCLKCVSRLGNAAAGMERP